MSSHSRRSHTVTPKSERQQLALVRELTRKRSKSVPPSSARADNELNGRGETALHLAAIKGDVVNIKKLLASGASPNSVDFAGWTPLHEASIRGWYDAAVALLQAKADVNARGLDDDTPLHDAAVNGHVQVANLLLEFGADVTLKNKKGKTPEDVASFEVLKLFSKKFNSTGSGSEDDDDDDMKDDGKTVLESKTPRKDEKISQSYLALQDDTQITKSESGSFGTEDDSKSTPGKSKDVKKKPGKRGRKKKPTLTHIDAYIHRKKRALVDTDDESNGGPAKKFISSNEKDGRKPWADSYSLTKGTNVGKRGRKKDDKETGGPSSAIVGDAEKSSTDIASPANSTNSEAGTEAGSSITKTRRRSVFDEDNEMRKNMRKDDHLNVPKMGKGVNVTAGSPKPGQSAENLDNEDGRSSVGSPGPKVPPLKIVIPSQGENEQNNKNGKNVNPRHHGCLPYVVVSREDSAVHSVTVTATSSSNSMPQVTPAGFSSTDISALVLGTEEQKSQSQHRVLRSNQRVGCSNSSVEDSVQDKPAVSSNLTGNITEQKSSSTLGPVSIPTPVQTPTNIDIHPKRRKLKASKEAMDAIVIPTPSNSHQHPHEIPVNNNYQLFIDIRKHIEKKRESLFPIHPKPPSGFEDYLINKRNYILEENTPSSYARSKIIPNAPPDSVPQGMRAMFVRQETERCNLRAQHVIQKEKLVLSVEQEILRVHGRAARALANQPLPYSVCSVLKDNEVYNVITPEQEEKDTNARSRYNGRLFISWLQDVDDKWEKIKEEMLKRHHLEAEGLHNRQKIEWTFGLYSCGINPGPGFNCSPLHVPIINVLD